MNKARPAKITKSTPFNWCLLVFQFFCFSLAGWIYEVLLNVYYQKPFENRGFLYGPYLPVYGVGGLILVLILFSLLRKKIRFAKINCTPVLIFIGIIVLTTILELATGLAMETMFDKRWWDYSDEWLNFRGHICPLASFRFGVIGLIFLYFVNAPMEKLFNKLSIKNQQLIAKIIIICLVIDLIAVCLWRI